MLCLQWVQRVTLKDLMPDAKSVFKLLFKTVNIQEPAFNDTIILYRRDADSKHAEQEDEKKPVKPASYVSFPSAISAYLSSTVAGNCDCSKLEAELALSRC